MIRRLICWLTWHRWGRSGGLRLGIINGVRFCARCGAMKIDAPAPDLFSSDPVVYKLRYIYGPPDGPGL